MGKEIYLTHNEAYQLLKIFREWSEEEADLTLSSTLIKLEYYKGTDEEDTEYQGVTYFLNGKTIEQERFEEMVLNEAFCYISTLKVRTPRYEGIRMERGPEYSNTCNPVSKRYNLE